MVLSNKGHYEKIMLCFICNNTFEISITGVFKTIK